MPALSLEQILSCSPLGLLACKEGLEDLDHLAEGGKVRDELGLDLGRVVAQFGEEVGAVGDRRHGRTEDGLDQEAVMGLERVAVGAAERVGELGAGVLEAVVESLVGEVEATVAFMVSGCLHLQNSVRLTGPARDHPRWQRASWS